MRKFFQVFGTLALIAALWVNVHAATISFTVPDAIVPELILALEAEHGSKLAGESNAVFVRRTTRAYWKSLIDRRRNRAAEATAVPVPSADLGDS
jgi:hypothetical protein